MKVLISAYACEPGAGSEPGVGWTWARAAAEDHGVWMLTRTNNAEQIEAELAKNPCPNLHPVYLDMPPALRFWKRGQRGVHLYYVLWQLLARRKAIELHATKRFDLAHHLTLASDWLPAGVVGIPGLPSIWGPVGGCTSAPPALWRWLGFRGLLSELAKEALTRPARRLTSVITVRRAAMVVAQNHDVARRFSAISPEVIVEPNAALDHHELHVAEVAVPEGLSGRRRALFVGRLMPWKGLMIAVAALTDPRCRQWSLDVIGTGTDRARVERFIAANGLKERVRFHGQQARSHVLGTIAQVDVLLAPAMHEAAGWAVAEAVSLGTPVVCLNRGGPPVIAPDDVHISSASRNVVADVAEALCRVPCRREPSLRWGSDRLPRLVSGWYERVRGET